MEGRFRAGNHSMKKIWANIWCRSVAYDLQVINSLMPSDAYVLQ